MDDKRMCIPKFRWKLCTSTNGYVTISQRLQLFVSMCHTSPRYCEPVDVASKHVAFQKEMT
ncbi:hypothetical protein JTE90_011747, partial [Oedothorax gibbosus]